MPDLVGLQHSLCWRQPFPRLECGLCGGELCPVKPCLCASYGKEVNVSQFLARIQASSPSFDTDHLLQEARGTAP
ncbi:hypothetical protein CB1_000932052 [Camelus ferus]|nr:hypothetical protein CB1_000932052 [Camelus ferus]